MLPFNYHGTAKHNSFPSNVTSWSLHFHDSLLLWLGNEERVMRVFKLTVDDTNINGKEYGNVDIYIYLIILKSIINES